MPIYYSQNYIQNTNNQLNMYIQKIQNEDICNLKKYKYIKKIYKFLKNKKSLIRLIDRDIKVYINTHVGSHLRFVENNSSGSPVKLMQTIKNVFELVVTDRINNLPSLRNESNDSSESDESEEESDD
jgi:hypothetical protein